MDNLNSAVQVLIHGSNTLFILLGAVMVLAMHAASPSSRWAPCA